MPTSSPCRPSLISASGPPASRRVRAMERGSRRRTTCALALCTLAAFVFIPGLLEGELGAQEPPPPPERVDLLSWGAGAFVVRLEAPATMETAKAVVDGSPRTISIGIPRREPLPHGLVVELPAPTTFRTFVVPPIDEFGPARGRHVKTVVLEGSDDGPETGFRPLATLVLEMDRAAPQEFAVTDPFPVRWVRIELRDRLLEAPADFDPHTFSELQGFGEQQAWEVPEDRFTGRWRLRRTGIHDAPGLNIMELVQEGTKIRGCQQRGGAHSGLSGSLEGGLASLVLELESPNGGVPAVATVTEEGDLVGARFAGGFHAFWATRDDSAPSACGEEIDAPDPIVAAMEEGRISIIYGINFDVDSDRLRPDATPALERILGALESLGDLRMAIEGHTDSDGSEAHNLDLSQRRAEAVVAWLVERGVDAGRLRAVGKGEAEPVADNETSAGKALNRRVEVGPG